MYSRAQIASEIKSMSNTQQRALLKRLTRELATRPTTPKKIAPLTKKECREKLVNKGDMLTKTFPDSSDWDSVYQKVQAMVSNYRTEAGLKLETTSSRKDKEIVICVIGVKE